MSLVDEIMNEADVMADWKAEHAIALTYYEENPSPHTVGPVHESADQFTESKNRLRTLIESLAQESKAEGWKQAHECGCIRDEDCAEFHPNPYQKENQ